jgi:diaminohydroxyphosphoribosylaminopyrimidine deaminase
MEDILKELGRLEIDSVLLEGGSGLISAAFKENIVDAGEIFIAPKIIGDNSAVPFINGFNFDSMEDVFKISNPKFSIYGDNISIEFEKNK